jgi:hypothetical protein
MDAIFYTGGTSTRIQRNIISSHLEQSYRRHVPRLEPGTVVQQTVPTKKNWNANFRRTSRFISTREHRAIRKSIHIFTLEQLGNDGPITSQEIRRTATDSDCPIRDYEQTSF